MGRPHQKNWSEVPSSLYQGEPDPPSGLGLATLFVLVLLVGFFACALLGVFGLGVSMGG